MVMMTRVVKLMMMVPEILERTCAVMNSSVIGLKEEMSCGQSPGRPAYLEVTKSNQDAETSREGVRAEPAK